MTEGAAFLQLDAADEKSREGNAVAIRDDLANDLRVWLTEKLALLQSAAHAAGEPIPDRLLGDTVLFDVPDGLVRILDHDLKAAGIPKREDRGRTVDVHAMRTTFGTLLSRTGAAPRTAQAAMRHSDIKLTMGVYTDPRLLDVRGAMEKLPSLPLNPNPSSSRAAESVAPAVAPTRYNRGQFGSSGDHTDQNDGAQNEEGGSGGNAENVNEKPPLPSQVSGGQRVGLIGFEPSFLSPLGGLRSHCCRVEFSVVTSPCVTDRASGAMLPQLRERGNVAHPLPTRSNVYPRAVSGLAVRHTPTSNYLANSHAKQPCTSLWLLELEDRSVDRDHLRHTVAVEPPLDGEHVG